MVLKVPLIREDSAQRRTRVVMQGKIRDLLAWLDPQASDDALSHTAIVARLIAVLARELVQQER